MMPLAELAKDVSKDRPRFVVPQQTPLENIRAFMETGRSGF
jgi:hypothetical protein